MELAIAPILAMHLMCVNLACAGPLVCLPLEWSEANGDALAGKTLRWLAGVSLAALAVGMLFGGLLAVLSWSPDVANHLWARLTSRLSFGVAELVFSAVLMLLYWLWCDWSREALWQRIVHRLIAVLAATNLIYHFPLLFGVVTNLIQSGELMRSTEPIDGPQFRALMMQGRVLSLATHFAVASFAVAGVALMLYAWLFRGIGFQPAERGAGFQPVEEPASSTDPAATPGQGSETDSESKNLDQLAGWGARWALAATLLQFPVGLWVWTTSSSNGQQRLMGGDALAMSAFGLSLAVAMWLLHMLFAAAQGESPRASAPWCAGLLGAVILLMSAALVAIQRVG